MYWFYDSIMSYSPHIPDQSRFPGPYVRKLPTQRTAFLIRRPWSVTPLWCIGPTCSALSRPWRYIPQMVSERDIQTNDMRYDRSGRSPWNSHYIHLVLWNTCWQHDVTTNSTAFPCWRDYSYPHVRLTCMTKLTNSEKDVADPLC